MELFSGPGNFGSREVMFLDYVPVNVFYGLKINTCLCYYPLPTSFPLSAVF